MGLGAGPKENQNKMTVKELVQKLSEYPYPEDNVVVVRSPETGNGDEMWDQFEVEYTAPDPTFGEFQIGLADDHSKPGIVPLPPRKMGESRGLRFEVVADPKDPTGYVLPEVKRVR